MAGSLRRWTTKEHRQSAEFDFVFHSGPLPKELDRVSKNAASFIASLHARMGASGQPCPSPLLDSWHPTLAACQGHGRGPAISGGIGGRPSRKVACQIRSSFSPGCKARLRTCHCGHMTGTITGSCGGGLLPWARAPEKSVLFLCPEDSRLQGWLAADPRVETLIIRDDYLAPKRVEALPIYLAACPCRLPAQA